jgi:hypothetical protein
VRIGILAAMTLLVACEPPPASAVSVADEALAITILYPPSSNDAGNGPFEILPQADGDYVIPVVVDVSGIELTNPYTDPAPELDDAQGHWHADVEGASTLATSDRFGELVIAGDSVTAPSTAVITVTMRENDHNPREDEGEGVEDTVEVLLIAP